MDAHRFKTNFIEYKGVADEHITVVVFSLGAIWKFSYSELKSLCHGNQKVWKTMMKSISANAFVGSLNI